METLYRVNGRVYDKKEDAEKAQKEFEVAEAKKAELQTKRKERAKEIDDARDAMIKAEKHYHELVNAFTHDYGAYHFSISSSDSTGDAGIDDLFDSFFRLF